MIVRVVDVPVVADDEPTRTTIGRAGRLDRVLGVVTRGLVRKDALAVLERGAILVVGNGPSSAMSRRVWSASGGSSSTLTVPPFQAAGGSGAKRGLLVGSAARVPPCWADGDPDAERNSLVRPASPVGEQAASRSRTPTSSAATIEALENAPVDRTRLTP